LSLETPPTTVGGISKSDPVLLFRLSLEAPPTSVGGIPRSFLKRMSLSRPCRGILSKFVQGRLVAHRYA
jgi:hypothetical protein